MRVPILAWQQPSLHGAALVWAQASFDYVVSPMACLFVVGWLAIGIEADEDWSLPRTIATGALAAVAPLLHETASLATLAAIVVLLIAHRVGSRGSAHRSIPRRVRAVVIVAIVSCLVQATSPGMWKRLGAVTDQQPVETGGRLMLLRAANTCWQAGEVVGVAVLAASLMLGLSCVVACRAGSALSRWLLLGAAAAHLLAMAGLIVAQRHWNPWTGLHGYTAAMNPTQLRWALVLVATMLGSALTALVMAILLVGRLGVLPLVALAGAAGSLVAPLLGGITATRAMIPMALWLVALVFALTGAWANADAPESARALRAARLLPTAALVVVLGVACWAVPHWWWRTWNGMRANEAVQAQVLTQIGQARRGERSEVVFPARHPHPELLYYYAFRLDRYGPMIRLYYDLPDSVKLVQAR